MQALIHAYTPHVRLHQSGSCWKTDSRSADRHDAEALTETTALRHYLTTHVCADLGLVSEQSESAAKHTHTKHTPPENEDDTLYEDICRLFIHTHTPALCKPSARV